MARRRRAYPTADWNGPERLYALMCRYRDAHTSIRPSPTELSVVEIDEFAIQLRVIVDRRLVATRLDIQLNFVCADIESIAQNCVMHLLRKSQAGLGQRVPGWRPMMKIVYQAIRNFILSELERSKRRFDREPCAADYYGSARDSGSPDMDGIASSGFAPGSELDSAGSAESNEITDVVQRIFDESEDAVLGDFVGTAAQTNRLEKLYRVIQKQIIHNRAPSCYSGLPKSLGVYCEEHAIIVARCLRAVRTYA